MGNCLQCFQSTSEPLGSGAIHSGCHSTQIGEGRYNAATTTLNANECQQTQLQSHSTARNTFSKERSHETDELLSSRSPLKQNHCDTKRSSFKKSLALLNGNAANMCDIITTVKETSEVSDNTLNKLFEEYKEPDEDMILAEGIERLCCDLNYQPDEFAILVLAWCLDASQMCRFTRSEFIEGLHKMRADTIETIHIRLEQTIETLKVDSELFKQLYRFTFRFGLEPDQRILSLDMAISLWKLVFTVHTPDILSKWIHFLEQHPSIRGIPKDTWNMFLNFSEQCDINNYDDTEAWPSLFDDFVDYEKSRLESVDDDNNNDDPLQQKQIHDNSSSMNVL
ncbi:defective in cullin neddylation 1 domain containing SCCRO3 [Haematobia irritans]|uniref:defective in cullin neddylation 1 domain containing SCCRO3 n=1 Tax=Haematobia irritans TaxID=7368 RepID=UPI003F4FCE93